MSGLLDRLRGIRKETTERVWSTTMLKNAPPTFVSDFIVEGAWSRYETEHLGNMARRDASAYAITTGIANNVFDDWFKFVKKNDPDNPKKPIMEEVQQELEALDAKKWMSLALAGERTFGHTWLYVGTEELTMDTYTGPPRVLSLDVFTPEYASPTDFDDVGRPTEITVKVLTNSGNTSQAVYQEIPIPVADCILFRTRPYDRSHEGLSALWPVWNALCGLNFIFHAITSYDMKIGVGALILTTTSMASDADVTAAQAAMEELSVTRVGVVPGDRVKSLEYIGAGAGATDFAEHINAFREEIAAGSKIPKDVLTGTSAGAITGSEVNSKALYAVIQGIQSSMVPYIRELVRRLGHTEEDYDIEWNTRYATDEMQQAQIRVLNAQADEAEQRIDNMKKGQNPNDIMVGFKGAQGQKPKDEDKNKNPSGRQ